MVGKLNILDHTGHSVVTFDTEKPETLVEAKNLFDQHVARGGSAFVDGARLKTWDPTTAEILPEEVTFIAPLVGG